MQHRENPHDLARYRTRHRQRKGIRVNAIAPGFVETDLTSEMSSDTLDEFLHGSSLGRTATQREIDAAVVVLASRASGYITGSTLAVDGGTTGH